MSLPDLSRLSAAPSATLRAIGQKLASIGLTLSAAQPVVDAVRHLDPALRQPVRAFYLRKRRDAVGAALRMFLFGDPVTLDEAREALGGMTDELLGLGLLEQHEGSVVSPFVLGIVDEVYLLSDALHHGEDAVMGLGETTVALTRAAYPKRPVGRVLDLGCGAGTGALLLARAATAVVGVDINPRAVALARVNAAINGITSADFRQGDGFAPVAGETFDLILSQPPFVARPETVAQATAVYGGAHGDEVALALLAATPRHLTPVGRAVFFVEWPEHGDAPLEQRLRGAVGGGALGPDLLILRAPPTDVATHAAAYAAGFHPRLGPAFEADVLARLQHLERAGIRELAPTLVVVANPRPPAGREGWTAVIGIEPFAQVSINSERIDKIVAGRGLAGRRDSLLAATLRVPDETVLSQIQVGPGAEVPSTLSARFAPAAAVRPIEMTMEFLFLITLVHEAPTVRAALPRIGEVLKLSREEALAKALPAVEEALLQGILEVAKV